MKRLSDLHFLSIAEAKKNFSEAVNLSQQNDVVVTRNGRPTSVLLGYDRFVKVMDFLSQVYELYLLDVGAQGGPGALDVKGIESLLVNMEDDHQEV